MTQTAVEWIVEQLEQKGDASVNVSIGRMQISIKEEDYIGLIKQAKEMEKQKFLDFQVYVLSEHIIAKEHFRKQRDEGLLEQLKMYSEEDMKLSYEAGKKRGNSGYPNTDNFRQPNFEEFIKKFKNN